MKIIIVDDEPLALQSMKKIVEDFGIAEEIKTFLNPLEALEWVQHEQIDIAFLDIEMPEINGMELGEQLLHDQPELYVVFVTAYNDYAVEAFEVNALDYVLKPVQRQRLAKTVERIINLNKNKKQQDRSNEKRMLCCFQYISFNHSKQSQQMIFWRTMKAQELFAYLIHYRHKPVHKEEILELLWPDTKLDKASTLLHTTIYQVRRTIQEHGIDVSIKYKDEGYLLEIGDILLDVDEWEKGVRSSPVVSPYTIGKHKELMHLYRGDYLAEYPYLWSEAEQERLRLIWLEHVKKVASFYNDTKQYTEAILYFNEIKDKHPYLEEGYFGLMKVNAALGYHGEVKKQFEQLILRFQEDLGVMPRKEVMDWYKEWLKG